jgi:alpha-tubulin suppressor-like RCC1 family protein
MKSIPILAGALCAFLAADGACGIPEADAYLKAINTRPAHYFGEAVAVSGDTMVVGARWDAGLDAGNPESQTAPNAGAVHVYVRSSEGWTHQAYLKSSNIQGGGMGGEPPGDNFGVSVAIDGDTLVVGASGEDGAATGVNGNQASNAASDSGAAYVFVRVNGVWSQQAYLKASNTGAGDEFGISVAISGDTIIVGAVAEDGVGNTIPNSGAAYVFHRSGTTWSQQAYLKASNADAGDLFGVSVGLDGDLAIVGAHYEGSNATGVDGNGSNNSASASGAAYLFRRNGTTWSEESYLKQGGSPASNRFFGNSVAVSGETAVVGAFGDPGGTNLSNGGAAWVFSKTGGEWGLDTKLTASQANSFSLFGWSVAISGDHILIGGKEESSNATGVNGVITDFSRTESGAAWLFSRDAGTWNQSAYLKTGQALWYDRFGSSVAIDGMRLLIGSPGDDSSDTGVGTGPTAFGSSSSGAAYAYQLPLPPDPNLDSDGDGWTDAQEIEIGSDPFDANSRPGMARAIRSWGSGVPLASTLTPRNVTKVAAGYWHALALEESGKVHAWGRNNAGQNSIPSDIGPVKSIAGGVATTILVKENGTVELLGQWLNSVQIPANLENVKAASMGASHAVVLHEDGTVTAWGASTGSPPEGMSDLKIIACGEVHTLGLKNDGTVVAWGLGTTNTGLNREFGQSIVPVGLSNVVSIAAGYEHSAALRADGTVVCWGRNEYGQTSVPPGLNNVVAISAGGNYTVALRNDGALAVWGNFPFSVALSGLGGITGIAAGAGHVVCFRENGSVVCVGSDNYSQSSPPPVRRDVVDISGMGQIGNQGRISLLSADGSVRRLGTVFRLNHNPLGPEAFSGARAIAEGGFFSVVADTQGNVRAWEQYNSGDVNVPAGLGDVVELSAGSRHTLALKADGSVVAWHHDNAAVQNFGQSTVPSGLPVIANIRAGQFHSLALTADGQVIAWGAGTTVGSFPHYGQSIVPPGLDNVIAIAAENHASLALKSDGTLVQWSSNFPQPPADIGPVKAITGGDGHFVALKSDGTVRVWGFSGYAATLEIPHDLGPVEEIFAAGHAVFAVTRELAPFAAPTDILISSSSVPEGVAAGALVGAFSATDADVADEFSFSLVAGEGDADNGVFHIDDDGNLRTDAVLSLQDGASRSIRVRVEDLAGIPFEKVFFIQVSVRQTTPLEAATEAFAAAGLDGDDALPGAIPFHDGVPNLLKYAFNMNLAGPDSSTMAPGTGNSGLPASMLVESEGGTVLRIEYVRRKNSGLAYEPRVSSDLDAFEPFAGTSTVTDIDDTWERVVVDQPCDPETMPRCFMRVEVILPPG